MNDAQLIDTLIHRLEVCGTAEALGVCRRSIERARQFGRLTKTCRLLAMRVARETAGTPRSKLRAEVAAIAVMARKTATMAHQAMTDEATTKTQRIELFDCAATVADRLDAIGGGE